MGLRPGDIDVGSELQLSVDFTDQNGVAINPTTVQLKTRSPCGTETTYTYGDDDEVERPVTGTYLGTFTATEAGTWEVRWVTTGPVLQIRERINVRGSWFDEYNGWSDYA